jgi:hypothetical protein
LRVIACKPLFSKVSHLLKVNLLPLTLQTKLILNQHYQLDQFLWIFFLPYQSILTKDFQLSLLFPISLIFQKLNFFLFLFIILCFPLAHKILSKEKKVQDRWVAFWTALKILMILANCKQFLGDYVQP